MYISVRIKWKYKDRQGEVLDKFGYPGFNPTSEDAMTGLLFWYEEGNGGCDCNRARIIGLGYDLPCGETIEFLEIEPLLPLPWARTKK